MSVFSRVTFTEEGEDEGEESGLLVELEGKDEKKERETNLWFSKVCSCGLPQCSTSKNDLKMSFLHLFLFWSSSRWLLHNLVFY